MKDKILIFVIGLLVGAVITASGFLIYEKANKTKNQMPNGERIEMMQRPDGERPPERPNGSENDGNRPEPPSGNNASNNQQQKKEVN